MPSPLLAIDGEEDDTERFGIQKRTISLTAGSATLLELADCRRVPHREKEDTILDVVRQFLGAFDS